MKKSFRIENGKIILENIKVPMVSHCVNRCTACGSFAPVADHFCLPKEIIKRDIYKLKEIFEVDNFFLFGGEALLHPDIIEIIDIVKESKISKIVTLLTNGQLLLEKAPTELWKKINRIDLTRYPGKIPDEKFNWIKDKCVENKVIFNLIIPSFAKIIVDHQLTKEETIKVWQECTPGSSCLTFFDDKFYSCCQFYYFSKYLKLNLDDSIKISTMTKESLLKYLDIKAPESCSWCTGLLDRKQIGWKESINKEEWWRESTASGI
jgi:hypothetical protein